MYFFKFLCFFTGNVLKSTELVNLYGYGLCRKFATDSCKIPGNTFHASTIPSPPSLPDIYIALTTHPHSPAPFLELFIHEKQPYNLPLVFLWIL